MNIEKIFKGLEKSGTLCQMPDGFLYLDVSDEFIHQFHELQHDSAISKPDYFDAKTSYIGAHISVVYPPELEKLDSKNVDKKIKEALGSQYNFEVELIAHALFDDITYVIVMVRCEQLIAFRKTIGLPETLDFRGYHVVPHITLGVSA